MRYLRFAWDDIVSYGALDEGGQVLEVSGPGYLNPGYSGRQFSLDEVTLLAPVQPSKVVCIGLNYRDHAEELGLRVPDEPTLFLKPPSAVVGTRARIIYPRISQRVDYEAELAVVIGEIARNISERQAHGKIFGYTCANDVTARDLQSKDGQWTRAKSFDTFCPLGPWIETGVDAGRLGIYAYVNGQRRQASSTENMIWGPEYLVSYVSQIMTLYPGDIILTGTPNGVGELHVGDEVIIELESVGKLENLIVAETA